MTTAGRLSERVAGPVMSVGPARSQERVDRGVAVAPLEPATATQLGHTRGCFEELVFIACNVEVVVTS